MNADITVDAKFTSCPGPLIDLANAVAKAQPGQVVKLLSTDPAAPSDVKEWASAVGHTVLATEKSADVFEIYVEVSG
ncbi:MAG: sulfurtransferase TusA family protein [Methanoregula sp.]|nr:sulfurtransferase TusA family protein [Methanoregula sp.]